MNKQKLLRIFLFFLGVVFISVSGYAARHMFIKGSQNIKEQPNSISTEELEVLISTGKGKIVTVPIRGQNDISIILKTGVIIMTQEPDYVVIIGNQERIESVKSLGFTLKEPVEAEHKLRQIKVWVSNKEQFEQVYKIASDVWPGGEIPGYILGRAFDYQIQWLRNNGFTIELKMNGYEPEVIR